MGHGCNKHLSEPRELEKRGRGKTCSRVYLVGGFELIIRLRVARNSARPADWPFRASLRRWARAVSGNRSSPRLGVVIVFKAKRFRDEKQGSHRLSIGRRAHWADRSGGNEGCVLRPRSNRGTKESSTHFHAYSADKVSTLDEQSTNCHVTVRSKRDLHRSQRIAAKVFGMKVVSLTLGMVRARSSGATVTDSHRIKPSALTCKL